MAIRHHDFRPRLRLRWIARVAPTLLCAVLWGGGALAQSPDLATTQVAPGAVVLDATGDAGNETVRAALEQAAALLAQGQASAALTVLEPIEKAEPENPWLWFYRGTAYYQLGEPYRSMEAYDRAASILKELGNPDPELASRIHTQRTLARRQVLHLSLTTGLAYDTNVSYLGSSIGPGLISGAPDMRFASQFQVDYSPIATAEHVLTTGVRLAHSWHFAVEQFNLQDYGAYVRYARKLSKHFDASIQYDYDFVLLGNQSFLSDHVLTTALTYHWLEPATKRFRLEDTKLYYRFEAADFRFETDRRLDRDGPANGVGLEQTFKWRPVKDWAWTWDLVAGYRFDSINSDGTEFDRREHNFYAGVAMPLVSPGDPTKYLIIPDKELIFRFNYQWQIGDYRRRSIIDSDYNARSDFLNTLNFGLSQVLYQSPDYGDLTLHGLISWTNAQSNVTTREKVFPYRTGEPFSYDKVVYGLQLEWSW